MQISTVISLTGENSHAINIPAGQGSFSIGTLGMNSKKFDIVVDDRLPEGFPPHRARAGAGSGGRTLLGT